MDLHKDGYTTKEMLEFHASFYNDFKHYKFVKNPQRYSLTSEQEKRTGIFLRGPHAITVYKNGRHHNSKGPANILLRRNNGKVLYSGYSIEGKLIPDDDILIRMIKAREV